MKHGGHHDSSSKAKISINFRVSKNNKETTNILKKLQHIKFNSHNGLQIIEHKIYSENGAAYAYVKTNLSDRPIKLLIDTGASISIIASNIITNETKILDFTVKLSGIVKSASVETKGLVHGVLQMSNCLLGTAFHLVDKEHAGPADGYLGYDFLMSYKATINISQMCLTIDVRNVLNEQNIDSNPKDYEHEDEFEKEFHKIAPEHSSPIMPQTSIKEDYDDYYEAINEYKNGQSKTKIYKVHRLDHEYIHDKIHELKTNYGIIDHRMIDVNTAEDRRSEYIYKKLNLSHCSQIEQGYVKEICEKYPHQFFMEGDIIGTVNVLKHKIRLKPNAPIINIRQYRIPHKHKRILDIMMKDFERQGIIEKCSSSYNSPVMLLDKTDDYGGKTDHRFVVDYSKLNASTEIEGFPIARVDDILDGLSGSKYFTILDLKGAYYNIEVDEESRDLTAFTVNFCKYRFIKMPMGLASAPFTWTRTITTIFMTMLGLGLLIYLDDMIIHAKTKEEHDKILEKVFKKLDEHNLKLKISKCIFYAKTFKYLGHIVTKDGYKANPEKIEVIKNYPTPTKVKEIQRFLGLCGYFRRYVPNFAKIAKPLTTLLKTEQPFIWTNKQQEAFDKLKKALAEEVTLAFPDFEQMFYVTTDASNVAIGAMLSQGELPNDRPIHFFSRTLSETQKRYSTTQKELLAIVEAVKVFRPYLYGQFFILITDHKALSYLFNMKDCGSRLFRQKLELMDYNFKVLYRPGAQNHVADALSRIQPLTIKELIEIEKRQETCHALTRAQARKEIEQPDSKALHSIEEKEGTILNKRSFDLIFHILSPENGKLKEKIINKFGITRFEDNWKKFKEIHYTIEISNQFANQQNQDKTIASIEEIAKIAEEKGAENIAINIEYENLRHYLFFKNTLEEVFNNRNISVSIFLNNIVELTEQEDIDKIMDLYHKSILGGHFGREKMYRTISKFYKWKNMEQNIRDYVKKCSICEKTKTFTNTKVPMQISSLGEILFDHVFIDFVGPIPRSKEGYTYITTMKCDVTQFLVAIPTRDCTALTAAICLLNHVLLKYNFPSRLISDNATSFLSQLIKELTKLFAIRKINVTPYHPQANVVERTHRVLNAYLRAFTNKNKDDWAENLKYATFAYNNSIHSTTGYTPHELAHGFRIQIPNQLQKPKLSYNYDNFADNVRNNIARALELAKEELLNRKLKNKQYYDANVKDIEIYPDDLILVKSQVKKHKFQDVYEGPYRVLDVFDCYVEIMKNGKKTKLHKNLIKKAEADYETEPPVITKVIDLDETDTYASRIMKSIYNIEIIAR